jgi:hypothetical protein
VLLAESFVLLALDPVAGRVTLPHRDTSADLLCAAGLLFDLLVQRRLAVTAPGRLQIDASVPSNHALLTAAATALAALPPCSAAEALRQVERRLAPLTRSLLEGLYRRDFLHQVGDWRFWKTDSTRYPLRSLQARNDAALLLQQASEGSGGLAGIGLLILAEVAGIGTAHLDARHHEQANQRLLGLNGVRFGDELGGVALIREALLA